MITLYTYGSAFGTPDLSPFVMKAQLLMGMAGLPYREDRTGYRKAPKGKLPYIDDNGTIVADSTFIRFHIEHKYGINFDKHLSEEQFAVAWAVEKMCEEHLYWMVVSARWLDDQIFQKIAPVMFKPVPALIRPLIGSMARRQVKKALWAQGLGRHSSTELAELAQHDLGALSTLLEDKPYLMGAAPCAVDASVAALLASILCPLETPIRKLTQQRFPNLVAYSRRVIDKYARNKSTPS